VSGSPSWISWPILCLCLHACGYGPAKAILPADVRSINVVQPNPARTHEPLLSPLLTGELVHQLRQAGVRASTGVQAQAELRCRILALETGQTILSAGTGHLAAQVLRLRTECSLRDAGGHTLWRSGFLEVEHTWPRPATDALASESSRRHALQQLAARTAARAVRLLTSGL